MEVKHYKIQKWVRVVWWWWSDVHIDLQEMGQLLKIHLLEKSARHQNLDCSTPFEQMTKYLHLLENQKSMPYV